MSKTHGRDISVSVLVTAGMGFDTALMYCSMMLFSARPLWTYGRISLILALVVALGAQILDYTLYW